MTLEFDAYGSGPTVLLLHSTVCDRRMWDPQVPVLTEAGFRVVRCDLPGYGDSPVPAGEYDEAALVKSTFMEAGPVSLVGSSGGGRVALEIAARWPGQVDALALICTALTGHPASPQRVTYSDREDELLEAGDIEAAVELNVATWVGPAADDATRVKVADMQRKAFSVTEEPMPRREQFTPASITARTLLISGAHDMPDFTEIADLLAKRIPHAEHQHLDWAGHLPSLESPDRFNPLLLAFLRG